MRLGREKNRRKINRRKVGNDPITKSKIARRQKGKNK